MSWVKLAKRNYNALNLRFMWSKPVDRRYDWKGTYTRRVHLWADWRLYIPFSRLTDAGYIDLKDKTIHVENDAPEAAERLQEVFNYLNELDK
jgi:hypothetical protein